MEIMLAEHYYFNFHEADEAWAYLSLIMSMVFIQTMEEMSSWPKQPWRKRQQYRIAAPETWVSPTVLAAGDLWEV